MAQEEVEKGITVRGKHIPLKPREKLGIQVVLNPVPNLHL